MKLLNGRASLANVKVTSSKEEKAVDEKTTSSPPASPRHVVRKSGGSITVEPSTLFLNTLREELTKFKEAVESAVRDQVKTCYAEAAREGNAAQELGPSRAAMSGVSASTLADRKLPITEMEMEQATAGRRKVFIKSGKSMSLTKDLNLDLREIRMGVTESKAGHGVRVPRTESILERMSDIDGDLGRGVEDNADIRSFLLSSSIDPTRADEEEEDMLDDYGPQQPWRPFFEKSSLKTPYKPLWVKAIESVEFDYLVGVIIMLNALWTGVETEYLSRVYETE
eukprot:TRINITY_DN26277_c0_g2_i3.p1 TRINITY_DN26277_c0_g2~~TRINITY_DN26277_c0_g2_i3.p1  ORF type:complete len:282 (+),score=71.50 TRINITY_DN26277_c0_g2_i3:51-896(+)